MFLSFLRILGHFWALVAETCGFNQGFKWRHGTPGQSALNKFKCGAGVEGSHRIFEEMVRNLLKMGVA